MRAARGRLFRWPQIAEQDVAPRRCLEQLCWNRSNTLVSISLSLLCCFLVLLLSLCEARRSFMLFFIFVWQFYAWPGQRVGGHVSGRAARRARVRTWASGRASVVRQAGRQAGRQVGRQAASQPETASHRKPARDSQPAIASLRAIASPRSVWIPRRFEARAIAARRALGILPTTDRGGSFPRAISAQGDPQWPGPGQPGRRAWPASPGRPRGRADEGRGRRRRPPDRILMWCCMFKHGDSGNDQYIYLFHKFAIFYNMIFVISVSCCFYFVIILVFVILFY